MSDWVAKIDDYGQAGWLLVVLAALFIAWPVGLAVFAYLVWSGRVTLGWGGGRAAGGSLAEGFEKTKRSAGAFFRGPAVGPGSGNAAFNAYRDDVLKRLEDEEKEFRAYVERLRRARDLSEFEQFMADRAASPKAE